jgi:O-acetyl-ADP-ribose deacetylase (regulator of RNase III)
VKEGALGLSDKQEGAMLVEFVDLSTGVPKFPKNSAAESATNNTPAADASATNKSAADKPASDKPTTE